MFSVTLDLFLIKHEDPASMCGILVTSAYFVASFTLSAASLAVSFTLSAAFSIA